MSGQWPPEWEDPDDGFPEETDQTDTEADARLSELAAYLASVPAPALPAAVEARLSAALAAESATRSRSSRDHTCAAGSVCASKCCAAKRSRASRRG